MLKLALRSLGILLLLVACLLGYAYYEISNGLPQVSAVLKKKLREDYQLESEFQLKLTKSFPEPELKAKDLSLRAEDFSISIETLRVQPSIQDVLSGDFTQLNFELTNAAVKLADKDMALPKLERSKGKLEGKRVSLTDTWLNIEGIQQELQNTSLKFEDDFLLSTDLIAGSNSSRLLLRELPSKSGYDLILEGLSAAVLGPYIRTFLPEQDFFDSTQDSYKLSAALSFKPKDQSAEGRIELSNTSFEHDEKKILLKSGTFNFKLLEQKLEVLSEELDLLYADTLPLSLKGSMTAARPLFVPTSDSTISFSSEKTISAASLLQLFPSPKLRSLEGQISFDAKAKLEGKQLDSSSINFSSGELQGELAGDLKELPAFKAQQLKGRLKLPEQSLKLTSDLSLGRSSSQVSLQGGISPFRPRVELRSARVALGDFKSLFPKLKLGASSLEDLRADLLFDPSAKMPNFKNVSFNLENFEYSTSDKLLKLESTPLRVELEKQWISLSASKLRGSYGATALEGAGSFRYNLHTPVSGLSGKLRLSKPKLNIAVDKQGELYELNFSEATPSLAELRSLIPNFPEQLSALELQSTSGAVTIDSSGKIQNGNAQLSATKVTLKAVFPPRLIAEKLILLGLVSSRANSLRAELKSGRLSKRNSNFTRLELSTSFRGGTPKIEKLGALEADYGIKIVSGRGIQSNGELILSREISAIFLGAVPELRYLTNSAGRMKLPFKISFPGYKAKFEVDLEGLIAKGATGVIFDKLLSNIR